MTVKTDSDIFFGGGGGRNEVKFIHWLPLSGGGGKELNEKILWYVAFLTERQMTCVTNE